MTFLGNGLAAANQDEDALIVDEAQLAMLKRLGESEANILRAQSNLAGTYRTLGRYEESMLLRRDLYSRCTRLYGREHRETLVEAYNLGNLLEDLKRFEEAKALLRETMPVTLRVLGESGDLTLKMRWSYARALYQDNDATLNDLREVVTMLEDVERIARRVLGGSHPRTRGIGEDLRNARAALAARETPPRGA